MEPPPAKRVTEVEDIAKSIINALLPRAWTDFEVVLHALKSFLAGVSCQAELKLRTDPPPEPPYW
jgi:hypothetical protein